MPRDFNRYRESYEQLSFQDKKKVYTVLRELYPLQAVGLSDMEFLLAALPKTDGIHVVEYGGYNGVLASLVLHYNPSWTWINLELIPHKPYWFLKGRKYAEIVLEKELWESPLHLAADVFLAENTVEHLSDSEFTQLATWLKKQGYSTVILSAPLTEHGQTWLDYYGAHVLTMGTEQVVELMKPQYRLVTEKKGKGWVAKFDFEAGTQLPTV